MPKSGERGLEKRLYINSGKPQRLIMMNVFHGLSQNQNLKYFLPMEMEKCIPTIELKK